RNRSPVAEQLIIARRARSHTRKATNRAPPALARADAVHPFAGRPGLTGACVVAAPTAGPVLARAARASTPGSGQTLRHHPTPNAAPRQGKCGPGGSPAGAAAAAPWRAFCSASDCAYRDARPSDKAAPSVGRKAQSALQDDLHVTFVQKV